ncbi:MULTISPECIES: ABCB family ABC transporter ATP-binding protein/permease [Sphingobium]|uniref:ABCB family ABC transporter ATP-binding protein/permease n=1 Tax=Sphingobium TaxID=165695 RepID=UPI0015EB9AAC|nr:MULTISPECIES: ATP-binding cassette domain-containing protein [Sphingobium]MCW2363711.1 ATP-binding cassette subfamily B protein [Sphingobium sp. B10D3B]MCW2402891.1 ATP-binding cassette subfamily B protein [Sphingobium sp. B10D7B]MCW2409869.1 ATP-binding cassette subfamily B protein [Sphingobium xanthum]
MPPDNQDKDLPTPPAWATLRRFLPYLWPAGEPNLKARIIVALVLVLLGKAIILVMPFAYKDIIDRMGPGMQAGVAVALGLVLAYAGARFGGVVSDNLRNVAFERVGRNAQRLMAEQTLRHLHNLSLRFHLNRKTGGVTKVIERGTTSIETMLHFLLFNIAPTAIELIAVCIIFQVKFGFGLVAGTLVMIALYTAFTQKITEWRNALRREMVDLDTGATAHAVDSLLNFETVKYFTAEDREAARYGAAQRSYMNAATKSNNSLAMLNIGQALITNVMMGGAMAFTVWGWAQGRFTPGDVVLVNALLMQLFRPLDLLGMVYRTIRQGLIDMEAMFRLIDTETEIKDVPDAPPLAVTAGDIRFEDVVFGYDPDRTILKGVSFHVAAGTTLAVVGHSGAGKSTIARLLFRFYDIQGGRILIDGQDIARVQQTSLRAAIGIVPQDMVLFNDTIGYNIAYGRDGATQADIEAGARGAAIDRFIDSLPKGYDTRVGERGLKLSGGEKQRVAIARTLVKDPPILVLDEATSALDSRTEAAIQTVLDDVAARRTTIIVAHRLSTIVHADSIIVMDDGRVVEQGTHAQLLALGGHYAQMWMRQQAERMNPEAGLAASEPSASLEDAAE